MDNISFNIVLYEPQIPQNTGNIARLCACTGSSLFLVGKLGFHITDKHMKRAGLDYWEFLDIKTYSSLKELMTEYSEKKFYFLTTKVTKKYTEISYNKGDFLVFGSETKGLPENIILNNPNSVTIPMIDNRRSLNLSNSVSIVVYEALRQSGY